jgi:hypothetical protein
MSDATRIIGTATGEIVWLGFPMNDGDRESWCAWGRQHGIDPNEALGFFEIDREARKIRWLAYDLNEGGHRFTRSDGHWGSASMREVQLDQPIAAFPGGLGSDRWYRSQEYHRIMHPSQDPA